VTIRRITLASVFVTAASVPAAAQASNDRPVDRFEVSLGAAWLAGADLGSRDAELRRNTLPTGDFRLFSADTGVEASPGFDGRVAFWFTRSLAAEAGFVVSRPTVRTRVTRDVEEAEDLTVDEDLDQYFVEGSAVLLLDRFAIGDRILPFVSGGAGYLRQLHEGQTVIETGQVYHVGGGVRYWLGLGDTGLIRAWGLRADARAYFLVNGFSLDDSARPHGAVSAAVFVTF
jgi:hypothetical protein